MPDPADLGFVFPCPTCGAKLRAPDGQAGFTDNCSECGETVRVPEHSAAEAPAPSAPYLYRVLPLPALSASPGEKVGAKPAEYLQGVL